MELMERWASRSDAWTPEDDVTLAEIVLRHIREGSTQLVAFDEAAALLGRTSAACGYRWNGVVRRHYEDAVKEAKQVRRRALEDRRNRRPSRTQISLGGDREFTIDLLIRGLRDFERRYHELSDEIERLSSEKRELEERLRQNGGEFTGPTQGGQPGSANPGLFEVDPRALLAIMERARRILELENAPDKHPLPAGSIPGAELNRAAIEAVNDAANDAANDVATDVMEKNGDEAADGTVDGIADETVDEALSK